MSLLEILVTEIPEVASAILSYLRAESDDKPPQLTHLPEHLETEVALLRAKARAAAAGG